MMAAIRWPFVALGAGVAALVGYLATRREVGAWVFMSAWSRAQATLDTARKRGVDRLCIFVNTEPAPGAAFSMVDRATVLAACAFWRARGLRITLVSWMTPRADWIDGAKALGALAQEAGADEVELDLEEDWTVLRSRSLSDIEAVTDQVFRNLRSTFRGEVGCDFIVYTDLRVIGPAIERSDFQVPQCYATEKNARQLPVGALERTAWARFKSYPARLIMGVAGWSQEGAYGLGYLDALRASLTAIAGLGVRRIRVWHLDTLDAGEGADLIAWKQGGARALQGGAA